jgi:hypothetical protein
MSNSLQDRDVLACSQHQADPLRHLGQGQRVNRERQRVNHVDRTNVADAGLSELHAVKGDLNPTPPPLLNVQARPDNTAPDHGHTEIVTTQRNTRQPVRIDIDALYTALRVGDRRNTRPWPATKPPSTNCRTTTQTTRRVSPKRTHRHNTCTRRARARYIGP